MRACTQCGKQFEPTPGQAKKQWWFCPECKRLADRRYSREYRQRRKALGLPLLRGDYKPYRERYEPGHFDRAEIIARRRERARLDNRKRRRDPQERIKFIARNIARKARQVGKLTPQPCADCQNADVEMHHTNYTKPLDVTWLCAKCHRKRHKQFARGNSSA